MDVGGGVLQGLYTPPRSSNRAQLRNGETGCHGGQRSDQALILPWVTMVIGVRSLLQSRQHLISVVA